MKSLLGKVVAIGTKTATVEVERFWVHPLYEKRLRRTKKYAVHVPVGFVDKGDTIEFVQARPISRTKKWIIKRVVKPSVQKQAKLPVT